MYSDFSTKNRERALHIFQKLQGEASNKQRADISTNKLLDEKYLIIADRLRAFHNKNERTFGVFEQQLDRFSQQSKILIRDLDKNTNLQKQLLDNFEKDMAYEYASYSESLKQIKKGMNENIQSKFKAFKSDAIQDISSDFDKLCKHNHGQISKKLQKLSERLQQQRIRKQQAAQFLIYKFGDEIIKLEEQISKQKQQRLNGSNMLFDRISEIEDTIQSEIKKEGGIREGNQEKLQRKLEDICYQIQVRVLGKN